MTRDPSPIRRLPLASLAFAGLLACGGGPRPEANPNPIVEAPLEPPLTPLAPLNAELRMVGSDTTWVARGAGFELVARSRADMPALKTLLVQQSRNYRGVFGTDPATLVVTVHRVSRATRTFVAPPPVPSGAAPVVEMSVDDVGLPRDDADERGTRPSPAPGDREGRRGTPGGRYGGGGRGYAFLVDPIERLAEAEPFRSLGSARRVLRAWLTARAGTPTTDRVPAWAEDAVATLGVDSSLVRQLGARLGAQPDSVFPLARFFTMPRPPLMIERPVSAQRDSVRGRESMSEIDAARSRGEMTGRGPVLLFPPLRGAALFSVQATVLGHYLTAREGPRFIGSLIDAQLQGQLVTAALSSAKVLPTELTALEEQWKAKIRSDVRGQRSESPRPPMR